MQVTSTLNKRTPFAFASDEDNFLAGATVLDEQEQEEVIQSLKVENDLSDRQIRLCLRIVMGCFAFLYAQYLFRRANPLSPFISTNAQPPRIPLDIAFALLHTIILLGLAVLCQLNDNTPSVRNPTPNYALVYSATAIAPTFCLLTVQGLPNIVWWSFALVAVALHHFFQSLILQGKKNISRLEGLKYNARGLLPPRLTCVIRSRSA
ncbi:hypothetical protein BGY98DRAFT_147357 [Russula aff. rugulosa BPL654]|nr:hypothetical protein BGY98DRAFT_147357 [Russula aff. rugulosa BPL654]